MTESETTFGHPALKQLIPDLLFIACCRSCGLFLDTVLAVDALTDQDRLDGGVSENDSGGEETVYYSHGDLYWKHMSMTCSEAQETWGSALHILLTLDTSYAPTGSSLATGASHDGTGSKETFCGSG